MQEITSKEYPQFVSGQSIAPVQQNQTHRRSPIRLKEGNGAVYLHPAQVTEIRRSSQAVLFHCTTQAYQNRLVYTHETSMFQMNAIDREAKDFYVQIELWSDRIFRVWFRLDDGYVCHEKELPEECRMLVGKPQNVNWSGKEENGIFQIVTSQIVISVNLSQFHISASRLDGKPYFAQRRNDLFTSDILDCSVASMGTDIACFESIELAQDEEIYGLGERFDGVSRKGRGVDFYNKDAIGTTSPRTYVNIPFYMSTKNYGLFLNSSASTEWEIGTKDASALGFGVFDDQMDYFVIEGTNPKQVLSGYCSLTGFAKLPPLWSFGLWMSRNSYTSWDMVHEIAKDLRDHDIPCDVIHLDTAWFHEDWNCDLKFSEERFPDPEEHMKALKQKGFRISLWQYNFIPPRQDNQNYIEASENGYFAKDQEGKPYQLPEECHGSWVEDRIIDFSNPAARSWYGDKISRLIRMGASAIKTDFGEGIPEDANYCAIEGKYYHNLYPLSYNYTVSQATKEVSGEDIVWARSGTAGSQRFPLHWGGDSQCTFAALAGTLRAALSIGVSGIPFFSHDIGGFIGTPSEELYIRWAQLGLFSSHARCHGAGDNTFREPWRFGERAERIFRSYAKLRYALMPYIYEEAKKCTQTGLPMIRALWLEYPRDRNVRYIDDEYLFGDSILIAPVLKPLADAQTRELYLPEGEWVDYWSRRRIKSYGMWIRREVDLETMPMYVKAGTTLSYSDALVHLGDQISIVKEERF